MCDYPIGSVVIHKRKPEFGYGIVVTNFSELKMASANDESIVMVLWHGDEERDLVETPQFHAYSELKVLNTTVGFA